MLALMQHWFATACLVVSFMERIELWLHAYATLYPN